MKRTLIIFLISFVSVTVQAQTDNPLKEGMPNTVTLSSGEVVYDINGEWEVLVEHYGPWANFGKQTNFSEIKQEGASFVGITLLDTQSSSKGDEKLRGELYKNGFKKVQTIAGGGPVELKGKILNNGNKMIFDDGEAIRLTCTRKQ